MQWKSYWQNIPLVQFSLVYPGLHTHVKASIESTHVLLTGQYAFWQSSLSTEHSLPVYPGGQVQAKSASKSYNNQENESKISSNEVFWIISSSICNLALLIIQHKSPYKNSITTSASEATWSRIDNRLSWHLTWAQAKTLDRQTVSEAQIRLNSTAVS